MQEEELLQAVVRNDVETARERLNQGADVDFVLSSDHSDYPDYGLLHVAVERHHDNVDYRPLIRRLVALGADVNLMTAKGTPLYLATKCRKLQLVQCLVEELHADINIAHWDNDVGRFGLESYNRTFKWFTPITYASEDYTTLKKHDSLTILKYLVERRNRFRMQNIHDALWFCHTSCSVSKRIDDNKSEILDYAVCKLTATDINDFLNTLGKNVDFAVGFLVSAFLNVSATKCANVPLQQGAEPKMCFFFRIRALFELIFKIEQGLVIQPHVNVEKLREELLVELEAFHVLKSIQAMSTKYVRALARHEYIVDFRDEATTNLMRHISNIRDGSEYNLSNGWAFKGSSHAINLGFMRRGNDILFRVDNLNEHDRSYHEKKYDEERSGILGNVLRMRPRVLGKISIARLETCRAFFYDIIDQCVRLSHVEHRAGKITIYANSRLNLENASEQEETLPYFDVQTTSNCFVRSFAPGLQIRLKDHAETYALLLNHEITYLKSIKKRELVISEMLYQETRSPKMLKRIAGFLKTHYRKHANIKRLFTDKSLSLSEQFVDLDLFHTAVDRQRVRRMPVVLTDFFNNRQYVNEKVLIRGKAGTGKSILCRRMACQWAAGELWRNFNYVFWIPLRNLTNQRQYSTHADYAIEKIVKKECLPEMDIDLNFLKKFIALQSKQKKILWILDGADEVDQDIVPNLKQLYQQSCCILTSRWFDVRGFHPTKYVEAAGFSEKNMQNYVRCFFGGTSEANQDEEELEGEHGEDNLAKKLMDRFTKDPILHEMAHTPIHLELICTLFQKNILDAEGQTLNTLYQEIINWLYYRYLGAFDKSIQLQDKEKIAREIEGLPALLGKIAFTMTRHNATKLTKDILDEVFTGVSLRKRKSNFSDLCAIDILVPLRANVSRIHDDQEYEFIHLSFQEYFFADFIVKQLSHAHTEEKRIEIISFFDLHAIQPQVTIRGDIMRKFLFDMVRERSVKDVLVSLILKSKKTARMASVASLAFTVLNFAGVSFENEEFCEIQAPDANLSGGIFYNTNFQNANLKNAVLDGAYLHHTRLEGANMLGVSLGSFFVRHPKRISCMQYSPSNRYIAVACDDRKVYIRSAKEFKVLAELDHEAAVRSVCWHPGVNVLRLAAGDMEGKIKIWEKTGEDVWRCVAALQKHTRKVTSIDWYPDSKVQLMVSSSTGNPTVCVWRYTEEEGWGCKEVECDEGYRIKNVVWSPHPDKKWIAVGSYGKAVIILRQSETGEWESWQKLEHPSGVKCVDWSSDAVYLASCDWQGNILIWIWEEPEGQYRSLKPLVGHDGCVSSVQWQLIEGRQYLTSGGYDSTVRIWDVEKGSSKIVRGTDFVKSISWCVEPNARTVAFATKDGVMHMWDDQNRQQLRRSFGGHQREVFCIDWLPDNKRQIFASCGFDGEVHIWDGQHGYISCPVKKGLSFAYGVTWHPDSHLRLLAVGGADGVIRILNGRNGYACQKELEEHTGKITSLHWHPKRSVRRLASAGKDNNICILEWEREAGWTSRVLMGHEDPQIKDLRIQVVWHPNQQKLLLASSDIKGMVRVWDGEQDYQSRLLCKEGAAVFSLAWCPDSERQLLAAGCIEGKVFVWDAASTHHAPVCLTEKGCAADMTGVCWYPGARRLLIVGDREGVIRVWDVAKQECVMTQKTSSPICCIACSPCGNYINIGAKDNAVRVFWFEQFEPKPGVRLCFTSRPRLFAEGAHINNARLSRRTQKLLKLCGAVGRPKIEDHTSLREVRQAHFSPRSERRRTSEEPAERPQQPPGNFSS